MYLMVDRITCGYGSRPVLSDFTLGVERGEFVAVVGPNGSGKSTLLRAISHSLRPGGGAITLGGQDIYRMRARELARHIAVVEQETAVEFEFTVAEVVAMGRLPHLAPLHSESLWDREVVCQAMALTDTLHLADRLVTGLSGGERQRVMVARALAQEPRLLLLDEPTAHLDIAHQVELLDLTRRLNRDQSLTVIAVLHDLNLAAQYATRLVMFKEGRVFADGLPHDVVTEENVTKVYGSRVRVTVHPEEGSPHVILLSNGKH